jgi:hypothetical protein
MRTRAGLLVLATVLIASGLSGCGDNNGNGNSVTTNDVTPGPSVSCSPGTRPGSVTAQTGEDRHGCTGLPTPTTTLAPSSTTSTP